MSLTQELVKFKGTTTTFHVEVLKLLVAVKNYQNNNGSLRDLGAALGSFGFATGELLVATRDLLNSTQGTRLVGQALGVTSILVSAVNVLNDTEALRVAINNPNATDAELKALTLKAAASGGALVADIALTLAPGGSIVRGVKILYDWAPTAIDVTAAVAGAVGDLALARELRRKSNYQTVDQRDTAEAVAVRATTVARERNTLLAAYGGMDAGWVNPTYFRIQQYETTLFRMDLPPGTPINRNFSFSNGFTFTDVNGVKFRIASNGSSYVTYPNGVEQIVPNGMIASVNEAGVLSLVQNDQYSEEIGLLASRRNEIWSNGGTTSYRELLRRAELYGSLGDSMGSALGSYLAGGDRTLGVVYSSLIGEIGERLAISISTGSLSAGLEVNISQATGEAVQATGIDRGFGTDIGIRAGAAAIGTMSSWLSMELAEALGLKGFGAELFATTGSTVTSHIMGNLLAQGPSFAFAGINTNAIGRSLGGVAGENASAFSNLPSALANAVGTFLGARLGAMVVSPTTQAGAALSSIGSAAGSFLAFNGLTIVGSFASAVSGAVTTAATSMFGTKLGAWIGNAVLPGVGAFIGFVLGALIGNLFGRKKPKTPTANAEVYLDYTSDQFQLGASSASNGGNLQLVRNMAETARDTLNGFLTVLAGDMPYEATSWGNGLWRNGKYIASDAGLQSFYGHTGGQLWVKLGSPSASQQNVGSADDAVSKGVMWSIKQTQIIGGDIFAKRALANSAATDLTAMMGDLQIASDYRFYANNRELINGYITGAYNSLNQAEKDFYATHKATIDKVHTKGVAALDSNEHGFYYGHKPTVDKIISALEDQAIANPWIITLQRINELKLDQWNGADFNGGLQGFLTSMGLSAYGAHFEDVRVSDLLGGMTLSVKGPNVQDGVFSILPQALDKPLGNDLLNPHFSQGNAGWHMSTWNAVAPGFGVNMDANWSGNGNDVLWNRIGASSAPGSVTDIWSEFIDSRAGATYEFSVKAAQHRGLARLEVQFLDANNNQVGWVGIPGGGREGGAGQGDLANFDTIAGTVVAPPGTVKRRMALRIVATGNPVDAYGFFTQPVTREIVTDISNYSGQTGLDGWEPASWMAPGGTRGTNLPGDWSGPANHTIYSHIPGVPQAGALFDNRSEFMSAEAGKTYDTYVMAAQHRGVAEVFVEFFDSSKNHISGHIVGSGGREYGGWRGETGNFDRIGGSIVAPPGTSYRRVGLRLRSTGAENPFAFFTQVVSHEVGAGAIDWSADGNAIRIDDLSKIGYTKLTDGNTAGRDFLDFSQRTAAVGWSDWSEQTHTNYVWDSHMQEYVEETQTVVTTGGDDIVVGSRYGDYLAGAAGWDWIDGGDGDGNDTIDGGDGNDVLLGGAGRDHLIGGAGDDYLVSGAGDDHPWHGDGFASGMWGGEGNDTIVFNGGIDGGFGENGDDIFLMEQDGFLPGFEASGHYDGNQMDYVDAGAGSDTVSYERFTIPITAPLDTNFWVQAANATFMPAGGINGVRVALWNHPNSWTNGDAYWADAKYIMGDWIKGVENVTGSRFNDYLWGDSGSNVIKGGDGDDLLDGADGDDILEGGAGADYALGSVGNDVISYEGSNAGVFIDFTTGEAFGGHATGDRFAWVESIRGSRFADELRGDANDNRIEGLAGDDWIVATKGSDVYEGGDGLDTADYSTGFSSGNATYQVWVEDGYWEWDEWQQRDVWISTGSGHYETQSGFRQGLVVNGGVVDWRSVDGTGGTHSLIGIEHVIGTAGDDSIGMTGSDDYITGGKGNDTLAGGGGGDTYYFNVGDGVDTINDNNVGTNVVSFGAGIGFNQLTFSAADGAGGHLTIYYTATDSVRINGNMPTVSQGKLASADDNRIKTIDMNGSGQLDVSQFEIYRGGTAGGDTIGGIRTLGDFIAGFGGNDTIYGMQPGQWEDHGNIIIGGAGDDTIYTSAGDDQFAFERGSGRDTINDTGGEDVLVFGPNVAADDVIYKVVGNDLYIGIRDAASPTLEAHQVADYIRVVNGGVKWEDAYGGGASFNTVEFINAGGTWIDLRKLDLNWTVQYSYNGGVMPIVFDLSGEGLELTGVESSNVVSRLASGKYARTSWVGPTNGILAFDRNGDGQINNLAEISFVQDREGAKTDLEGLQAWDTNGDGKLNALDAGWSNLKMWVDRNQNGRSTEQELRTLEQVGITEIDLKGVATGNTAATTRDSFVHNTLSFTWASGEKGTAYDVQLARRLLNELGLSAEQVRAAWGDGSATGELGRLASNPTVAAAARAVLGAPSDPTGARSAFGFDRQDMALLRDDAEWGTGFIADHALDEDDQSVDISIDFSDHDGLYADDEVRWSDVLNGTVSNGGTINDTDARVRATLDALQQSAGRGAFGQAFGRPEIEDPTAAIVPVDGQSEGQRTFAASSVSNAQIGAAERVDAFSVDGRPSSYGQLFDVDEAANLLNASSDGDDVWAPAEFSRASITQGRQWWRSAVVSPEGLPMLTPFDGVEQVSGIEGGGVQASASQHQQLVQALAAFGPKTMGGSSAIWKRAGEGDVEGLAPASADNRWRFAGPSRIHA